MKCTYCVDMTVADMTGGHAGYFRHQKPEVDELRHLTELKEKFGVTGSSLPTTHFCFLGWIHLEGIGEGLKAFGYPVGCSVMPNTITEDKVRIARGDGLRSHERRRRKRERRIRKAIKRNYKDDALIGTN